MKYNLINILGVLILMTSCVEENFRHELIPGEGEVDFTASVGNDATTKTFYGGINTTTGNEKVYWVHDDQITVFGAGCGNRAQANYKVSVNTTDADGNVTKPQQTYANELNKAGDYGVQWGDVAKTDFYAVYPSTSNNFTAQSTESTTDGVKVVTTTSATVETTVNPVQTVDFYRSTDGWKGIHYGSDVHNPSAPNAVMYACTKGAEAVDAEGNPKEVDLRFYPFSTVFRFTFAGFNITFEGDANATYKTMVYVNKITLTAPNNINIAGDFNLTITPAATATETNPNPRPTATAGNGSTNTITITPSTPIALETNQTVEFDVFTIPQEYMLGASEDPWKVTLETSGGNFTYNLIPKKVTGTDEDGNPTFANTTAKLEPGKIHNLSIPIKTIVKPEVQIPDDSWIAYIPRNVYLSELSVPGAWYSISEVYQGNIGFKSDITATINNTTVTVDKGLKTLYDAGVRAFHIDCRLTYKSGRSGEMDLYCAGTEESSLGSITSAGTLVSDALLDIASLIKDDEYVVVVLTIAEKPKSDSDNTLGNVNPNEVIPAIYNVLADKTAELKLYCPEEGINANTTINDVLGHMIVKINTNTTPDFFTQYLSTYSDHYALLSEASLATENASPIFAGTFNKMDDKPMYWGSNMIGVSSGTDGYETNPNMTYYYHQAQLTTDDRISESEYSKDDVVSSNSGPTLQNRIDAIDDIITESKAIYESSSHNAWFQISTGGTITYERRDGLFDAYSANCDIHGKVANVLNTHLITKIQNKIQNNETSPLGIVLMNYCTTSSVEDLYWREVSLGQTRNPQYKEVDTYGPELVSQIIELNRLFYLNRNKEAEEWPEGNPFLPQGASTSSVTKSTEGIVESTNVIIQTIQ